MTKYPYPEIVELPVGRKFGKDDNAVFIAYAPLTGNARLMTSDLAEELQGRKAEGLERKGSCSGSDRSRYHQDHGSP